MRTKHDNRDSNRIKYNKYEQWTVLVMGGVLRNPLIFNHACAVAIPPGPFALHWNIPASFAFARRILSRDPQRKDVTL